MTPRERYEAVLTGNRPDFLPRIPLLMQFAAEHIGSNYGAFASDHRILVEANIRCAEDFGIDQLSAISDPYRETEGFGATIVYHENSGPECVQPPLAGRDDLSSIRIPDPENSVRMKDRIDAIRLYRERTGDHYSILGWVEGPAALAGDLRGLSDFLMDLLDEPDDSVELLDLCTETAIVFARAQIEAGADTIGVGDAICSQISPQVHAEYIAPRQARLFRAIREAGARVRLHICGQTGHLQPALRGLDIDIFDCDHLVDLGLTRQWLGPSVTLAGNIDPVAALRFGNPLAVRSGIKACRDAAGAPFMVCAGCEVPSGTPVANLREFCRPLDPPAQGLLP